MANEELLAGLRELIQLIESNPDFDFTEGSGDDTVEVNYRTWYLHDTKDKRAAVKDLVRRLGSADKVYGDNFAWVRHQFGPHVKFTISAHREVVCERVVVGKQMFPAEPERIVPATPAHMVEIVEWKCAPILAEEVGK